MHVLIVHCHPEPQSFNASLTRAAVRTLAGAGASVRVDDLYADGFDPLEAPRHYPHRADPAVFRPLAEQRQAARDGREPPDVARRIAMLEAADLVLLQFPLWWHAPPAMLKGWLDRVFVNGRLYTSRMRYENGYFRGRRAICCVTTGAPAAAFGPGARGGDPSAMLWPLHYSLHYMGFSVLAPFMAHGIQGAGYAYRPASAFGEHAASTLAGWQERLAGLSNETPLVFPGWSDWDEDGAPRLRET